MPRSDLAMIRDRSAALEPLLALARKPADTYRAARQANHDLVEYFGVRVEEHRREPRDDLLSRLIASTDAGDALGDGELIATCVMLQFAAHTTTTHLLGNGLLALLRHPDQEALLRRDLTLVSSAVEEQLRYDGPFGALRRVALEPIDFAGTRWETGDVIFLMVNAANRDERRFADPDRFDVQRRDNHHIAFGVGSHFCSGAALARLEANITLAALLRRTASIGVIGDDLEWVDSVGFRGLKALPLRMEYPISGAGKAG